MKNGLRRLLLAVLALCMLSCGGSGRRIIVLLIVDTLRADHLGCYGYGSIDTPHIDRLAKQGTLYENAITAVPVTLPSIASILTGAYPLQHGIRDNGAFQLGDEWVTLAERLQQAGFATGAFVSAAVLSHEHNLSQGFDLYDDDMSAPYIPYHPEMVETQDRFQGIERRATLTVDRAIDWLRKLPRGDTFLFVHLFDPHVPQDPPPPFRDTYQGRFYDGEIAYADAQVGRLLEALHELWGSDVVTIFLADHGEGLGDHGEQFHGDLLYDETVRVPLIVSGGGVPRDRRVAETVRTIDVVPTICSIAGIDSPPWSSGSPLPGVSDKGMPRVAYMETFRPRLARNWCELRGVRTDAWKLVEGPGYELFDLREDPRERSDVQASYPSARDSLIALMDASALESLRRGSHAAAALELSDEQRRKLESLGYITPKAAPPAAGDSLAIWYFPPEERGRTLGLPHPREKVSASYERIVAESYYGAAQAALNNGDYTTAAQRFEMALRHKRAFPEAWLGMAEVARRVRRPDVAVRYLTEARKVLPDDAAIVAALADALVRDGQPDSALVVLDEAVEAGMSDSLVVHRRASLRAEGH